MCLSPVLPTLFQEPHCAELAGQEMEQPGSLSTRTPQLTVQAQSFIQQTWTLEQPELKPFHPVTHCCKDCPPPPTIHPPTTHTYTPATLTDAPAHSLPRFLSWLQGQLPRQPLPDPSKRTPNTETVHLPRRHARSLAFSQVSHLSEEGSYKQKCRWLTLGAQQRRGTWRLLNEWTKKGRKGGREGRTEGEREGGKEGRREGRPGMGEDSGKHRYDTGRSWLKMQRPAGKRGERGAGAGEARDPSLAPILCVLPTPQHSRGQAKPKSCHVLPCRPAMEKGPPYELQMRW